MRFMPQLLATCAIVLQLASPLAQAQTDAAETVTDPAAVANRYFTQSEISKQVGEAYFDAYINKDWDKLGTLLADRGNFNDPTARLVFGQINVTGKAEVLDYFRRNYPEITMKFLPQRKTYSGHYAIFEGMLNWTYQSPNGTERVVMPFINILQIEGGKVVKHTDLADYHPFFKHDSAAH
jgi:ketosteroid isomerase-like protein